MFPINWNRAFRKKDGTLVNMEDMGGGSGGALPPHTVEDAGKVLGVDDEGNLAWVTVSGGGFGRARSIVALGTFSSKAKEVSE